MYFEYRYIERTYLVRGINVTILEKIKFNEAGEEVYDPELEQENDLKLYSKHRDIVLEMLEKGEL